MFKITQIYDWFVEGKDLLLENLNNRLFMEKKLEMLNFKVEECNERTHGELIVENKEKFNMTIFFNPNDTENFIRFVIGHELVHLLFVNSGKLLLSGYCATDNSFAKTNVIRKSSNRFIYGEQFEELLCDYISLEILFRIRRKETSEISRKSLLKEVYYGNIKPFTEENFNIVKDVVNSFGEDISNVDKFDEFVCDENDAFPKNVLLYSIISGDLNIVINDYDECMGKGAWKLLNHTMDRYFINNIDKSFKFFIESELKRLQKIDVTK